MNLSVLKMIVLNLIRLINQPKLCYSLKSEKKITVQIPCLNEEATIGKVISKNKKKFLVLTSLFMTTAQVMIL